MKTRLWICVVLPAFLSAALVALLLSPRPASSQLKGPSGVDLAINHNAQKMVNAGRQIFRFDTFGDEDFWGGMLQLHLAIEGKDLGGVGPGVSPKAALALGLKVDVDALPADLINQLQQGQVDLDSPATTLALLKLNAVVGVTGFFNDKGTLRAMGIQCALCHSVVDRSVEAPGIPPGNVGHRLDGWANRDLDVGAIVAAAPNVKPITDLLKLADPAITDKDVRAALLAWGPGKFDAELILDGKAFRPDGKSGATLIPPAFGLAGVNLHTWTGWGSVTHWNAFVANLEMHGQGRFFDPRLNNKEQFPIAAQAGFGDLNRGLDPDEDQITSKLPALHFYQLAIPAPTPPKGSFDEEAAKRGDELFSGKARCNECHVEPLFTEPGWNLHTPDEIGLDDFQANRAPDRAYRTSPLAGLWTHVGHVFPMKQTGFFHDGRFATLLDVMNHYDQLFNLGLTDGEKNDLVEYMKALPEEEERTPGRKKVLKPQRPAKTKPKRPANRR